jgi:hypothetical protein
MQIQNDKKYGAVAFGGGQFKWISFFCDPGSEGKSPNRPRVAPFSNDTHQFANITIVTIGPATQKVTVKLPKAAVASHFSGRTTRATGPRSPTI